MNMATRTIHLIRHGQYHTKPDTEVSGSLTDIGREQAALVGAALIDVPLSEIHCSSLRRAEETAEIICESIPGMQANSTELLWELVPTIPPHLEDYFEALSLQNPEFSIEKVPENRLKADTAFQQFFIPAGTESDNIAIVCHGNLIRYLVCQALAINPDKWSNMYINHCSLTRILVEEDGNMILVSYNETGHLPLHLRTER